MIYLDNSASTLVKPKEVIRAVNESLLHYGANPGRSGHKASIKAAMEVENTRIKLSKLYNCPSSEDVIFTQNCTEALNLAILGSVKKDGHVICTENEHNSVLRPLEHLKSLGLIDFSIAYQHEKTGITARDIEPLIQDNTYLVICNHISNVNGDKADLESIGKLCKEKGLFFMVDGAQSCGHEEIDMEKWNINLLAFAGHKGFYAPQSIGGLLKNNISLDPIKFGGTGTNSLELKMPEESPERFESGTISTPLIMGLSAGIDFTQANFREIKNRLDDLTTYLNYELSKLPAISYTQPENSHGVLAFNVPNVHSNEVANYLDEKWNICVRAGYQCAPLKHKALGTLEQGVVRVSISYFNNFSEIQKLIMAIKTFLRKNKMN